MSSIKVISEIEKKEMRRIALEVIGTDPKGIKKEEGKPFISIPKETASNLRKQNFISKKTKQKVQKDTLAEKKEKQNLFIKKPILFSFFLRRKIGNKKVASERTMKVSFYKSIILMALILFLMFLVLWFQLYWG